MVRPAPASRRRHQHWREKADDSPVTAFGGALLNCPCRAGAESRFTGARDRFTRPSANAEISSTRSMARTIAVPVVFTGGVRSRSSSGTRLPPGTSSS